ncbi:MAG: hypothetical protein CH6_0085 [Candidatus Kapaibacterium sp.]|nr:MAG: hypothetical protein CH6_0085 [Candidatus Kapabacteria bacterium]
MTESQYFLDKILLGAMDLPRKWHFQPLEIVFTMASPIALSHPWIHLDGLISHLALRKLLGYDYFLLPSKFPIGRLMKDVEIPYLPYRSAGLIPQCSISFFEPSIMKSEKMYKKAEIAWLGKLKKLYQGSGHFKAYVMHHIYVPASKIRFYIVGDIEGLRQMLDEVVSLGDNTRIGWGRVLKYEINPIDEDRSIVWNGKAQRPIPVRFCKKYSDSFVLTWRSPYWSSDFEERCVPPLADVELLPETLELMRLDNGK